jgi:hypothetical protein
MAEWTIVQWHAAFAEAALWTNPVRLTKFEWYEPSDTLSEFVFYYRGILFKGWPHSSRPHVSSPDQIWFLTEHHSRLAVIRIEEKRGPIHCLTDGVAAIKDWLNGKYPLPSQGVV